VIAFGMVMRDGLAEDLAQVRPGPTVRVGGSRSSSTSASSKSRARQASSTNIAVNSSGLLNGTRCVVVISDSAACSSTTSVLLHDIRRLMGQHGTRRDGIYRWAAHLGVAVQSSFSCAPPRGAAGGEGRALANAAFVVTTIYQRADGRCAAAAFEIERTTDRMNAVARISTAHRSALYDTTRVSGGRAL
jgi:hypothetical protein